MRLTNIRRINPRQSELPPATALDIDEKRIAVRNGDDEPGKLRRRGLRRQRISGRGQHGKRE